MSFPGSNSNLPALSSVESPSEKQDLNASVPVPVVFRRNRRARNYLIAVRKNQVTVTIPRSGSQGEAEQFVYRRKAWIERVLKRLSAEVPSPQKWEIGTRILFRGELVPIQLSEEEQKLILLNSESFPFRGPVDDLRPQVEGILQKIAIKELPNRVQELAQQHESPVTRVAVRNQKSRWGSCSRRGTISLNWRLIQLPPEVRDYIILHELMHLREMNHSQKFWAHVEDVCPDYKKAHSWLKANSSLLGL